MEFNCENCGWSKDVESHIFCGYSEKRTFQENCCEAWKPKNNSVTNADKIRNISDEELAKWLSDMHDSVTCPNNGAVDCNPSCKKCWLDWLKQEVESDD